MIGWLWVVGQALAGCDASGIEAVVEAVPQVGAEHHPMMAATGFAQACTTPPGIVKAAQTLPSVPPDMRPMIDMKAAADAPLAWNAVCSGGLRVLSEMAALSVDKKRSHLWTGCDLQRLSWFSREEWLEADGSIVVTLAGAQAAADAGIRPAHVRVLARALAGIGDGAPDEDPLFDRFVELELPELVAPEPVDTGGFRGGGGGGGYGELRGGRASSGATSGTTDDKPHFAQRVEPTWSKKAVRKGGSCTVQVFVTRDGALRNLEFVDCDGALQGDVRTAVEASQLTPRTKDGKQAAGRFKAVFKVD